MRTLEWVEDATAHLPAHERQRRSPEREMVRRSASGPVVRALDQRESCGRILASSGDLGFRQVERTCASGHRLQ
jgi:hypothetical protein